MSKLKFKDLKNQSEYNFFDVTSELYREYVWLDAEKGRKALVIPEPVAVAVSKSGHRVLDSHGTAYFVPSDYTYINWEPRTGKPHFVK